MPAVYAAFAAMYAVFYLCGYPLRVLLLEDDLERFDPYITPWLGIGAIILFFFPLSRLGFPVKSCAGIFTAAVAAASAVLWVKYKKIPLFARRDVLLMTAIALLTGAIYGYIPASESFESFAVTSASDFSLYLNDTRGAMELSGNFLKYLPGGNFIVDVMSDALNFQLRGCVFVAAFLSALFKMDIARVFYFSSAFMMFMNVITFRVFLQSRRAPVLLLVLGILPFNVFYQQMVFMAYAGQLFSFGAVTLAFYLEYHLAGKTRLAAKTCFLLAFVLTFNGYCYLEGLAFPLLPVLALPLVLAANKRYDFRACVSNAALVGGIYAIFNIPAMVLFVRNLLAIESRQPAWEMYLPTFMDILGLQRVFSTADGVFALMIVSNLLAAAVLARQLKKEGMVSFLSVSFALYLLLHAFFCLRYFDRQSATSYNSYKSALSLSFVAVILLLRFAEEQLDGFWFFWEERIKISRSAGDRQGASFLCALHNAGGSLTAAAIFLALFAFNARASWLNIARLEAAPGTKLTKSAEALRYFAESPAYSAADFIVNSDFALEQFTAAFYLPFGRTWAIGYIGYLGGESALYRAMKNSIAIGDIYVSSSVAEEYFATISAPRLFRNDVHCVFRIDGASILRTDYEGLSHDPAAAIDSPRGRTLSLKLTGREAVFKYASASERDAYFGFSFFGENLRNASAVVTFNDLPAGEFEASNGYIDVELNRLPLKMGANVITVTFQGDIGAASLVRSVIR
jgi:hypothetical protein